MKRDSYKPTLLVISPVLPFPGKSGQQQRVKYMLLAAKEFFKVTFLTITPQNIYNQTKEQLMPYCDELFLLPSIYLSSLIKRSYHKLASISYSLYTGLRPSNYLIGELEFHHKRIIPIVNQYKFDVVLFEYWHTWKLVNHFNRVGSTTVLDMHDILWRSYEHQWNNRILIPSFIKKRMINKYRSLEENAWGYYDVLIAISTGEYEYVRNHVSPKQIVFNIPMGIDLEKWKYCWAPELPPKIMYYGGLNNPHRLPEILRCYSDIMPIVWNSHSDAQLWFVGSDPHPKIIELTRDARVKVTGYVENVENVLKTATCVICPWKGKFGFRSRIIELMAIGVPIICSPEAVYGMDIDENSGVIFANSYEEFGKYCLMMINSYQYARIVSKTAHHTVISKFNLNNTYQLLFSRLAEYTVNNSPL